MKMAMGVEEEVLVGSEADGEGENGEADGKGDDDIKKEKEGADGVVSGKD